jgi:transposase-like protein
LRVSRQHVGAALAAEGVQRRQAGRACPATPETLRCLYVEQELTQAQLAKRFGVAAATMGRWLAECGLGTPDPRIDHDRLHHLYVEERQTVREVAAEFGVPSQRVIRELALMGIPRRSRHDRRPRGPRANVTRATLEELYVMRGLTVAETARRLGVSTEYLCKRLRDCGIAKRPGSFRPKVAYRPVELAARAAELYDGTGLTMADIAEMLGVSVSTVRLALHEAGVSVRPGGFPHNTAGLPDRRLLEDLYADPEVRAVLVRHDVAVQDPAGWRRPGPFATFAPLPLSGPLLRELYEDVGLSAFHIGLLCGTGSSTVLTRLRHVGIPVRPPGRPCPWLSRTYLHGS